MYLKVGDRIRVKGFPWQEGIVHHVGLTSRLGEAYIKFDCIGAWPNQWLLTTDLVLLTKEVVDYDYDDEDCI